MEKENKVFKKQLFIPTLYFSVFYVVYLGLMIYQMNFYDAGVVFVAGLLIYGYLFGIRPYAYEITRKTLVIKKRIGKDKEVNLMDCETISNPIPKLTKLITNTKSFEIYLVGGKRLVVAPKERMEFVEAVIHANKRIHCQVEEYNESHRKFEKKRKRENRKLDKELSNGETID